MELPKRPRGDEFTRPGEYPELRRRVRALANGQSIPTVVVYAFDRRTRLLPYLFSTQRMAPAGARAVAGALHDSGVGPVRIVLQQWNPRFRPSAARLGGAPLELLLISSMQIHAEQAYGLLADACSVPQADRPLILAGGPKAIYEPWDLFDVRGDARVTADIAVTGEDYVLMQLVEVLLHHRGRQGTMREAFGRARREGALPAVPGLVYRQDEAADAPLVTTGVQRLVQDLDELPHPVHAYGLLERPHRGRGLRAEPLPVSRVGRHSPIGSLVLSQGCKFNCDYCPIPAYNQRTFRHKSGERVLEEMKRLREELGIRFFFGTDDNFFNRRSAAETMFEVLSRAEIAGRPLRKAVRWGTEATAHDTWKNRDLLREARVSGLRALWIGIEDLTATLIKKGQSVNGTAELFGLLNRRGILPMPMMMHHDSQPLYTRDGPYGLLNQVRFLRRHGAQSLQVTVLTPAVGTRSYEPTFEQGLVFERVAGKPVEQWQFDGNHVVASSLERPWRTQRNVLLAYAMYYNPVNLVRALVRPGNSLALAGALDQLRGMVGLCANTVDSLRWIHRLRRGPVTRRVAPPGPAVPLVDVSPRPEPQREPSRPAAGTPEFVQVRV